jgi:VCBS repeat-containing protein
MHDAVEPGELHDGLHPNTMGYEKMADAWLPAITSVITPLGTSAAPAIARLDARADLTHVSVQFSKPVADDSANIANFSLSGGVNVLQAELDSESKRVVTLTTSAQAPGTLYTLTVGGIHDRTPQQLEISPNASRTFTSRTLIDGSFESDGLAWQSTGNNQVVGSPLPATDGTKLLVFNGGETTNDGAISQVIATTPGQKYKLAFDIGVNGSSSPQAMNVRVDGHFPLLSETNELSGPGGGATEWDNKSYEFVANSQATTVTFEDASPTTNSVDLLLDDVRMNLEVDQVLTVTSSPDVPAAITVSPTDLNSDGDGTTSFTRTYSYGASVNLTAPATLSGHNFEEWQKNGEFHSSTAATNVTMDGGHTLKAVYSALTNGSFESDTTAWTVSGNQFAYANDGTYVANHGGKMMVFNGMGLAPNGAISQEFATTPGQIYTVSFDMGVIYGATGNVQQVALQVVGGAPLVNVTKSITQTITQAGPNLKWETKTHTFTADSALTTLTLTDTSSSGDGIDLLIDHVRVTFQDANTAPVAVADSYVATEDTPLVVPAAGVLANDTDIDLNSLTAVLDASPAHGNVTLNADGSFTYTPANGYTGPDSFTYHANDGGLDSNIATVSITVNAASAQLLVNGSFEDAPGAGPVYPTVTGWDGTGSEFSHFGYQESLPQYDATDGSRMMVFHGGNGPTDGAISQMFATTPGQTYLLTFQLGVVGANVPGQQLLVTLAGNETLLSETDSATGSGTGNSVWVAKNHVFVADSTTTTLTFTDTSTSTDMLDLLLDDVRVTTTTARALTVTSAPVSGIAITAAPVDLSGSGDGTTSFTRSYPDATSVTLTAPATSGGNNFVKWQKNGVDLSTDASVVVLMDGHHTLHAVYITGNAAPVAVADSYSVIQDTQLVIPAAGVLANDSDPEAAPINAVLDAGPSNGNLILNADGSFTYTPTAAYVGPDSFTYHANDGALDSNVVTVTISVNPVGSNALANGSFESGAVSWTFGGHQGVIDEEPGYDAEDGTKLMVFNGGETSPTGVISQSFATTPGQNYTLSFKMGLTFGLVGQSQRFDVQVAGATPLVSAIDVVTKTGASNPQWETKTHSFTADSPLTTLTLTDVSEIDSGIDLLLDDVRVMASANRTLSVTSSPVTGIAIDITPADLGSNGNGSTDFTRSYSDGASVTLSAPASSGVASFIKWQKNGVDLSTDTSVNVTMDDDHTLTAVYFVNTAPVAAADSYSATQNVALVISAGSGVLANDTDAQSSPLTALLNAGPAHGSLSLNTDGSFTYTPDSNYLGPDSFTYHANDGELDSAVATVSISVAAPNSLANGSFELGTTNWTVNGNHLVVDADPSYTATDGAKLMTFNGANTTPDAVIFQTFATTIGQPYKVELDFGVISPGAPQEQKLGVTVTGASTLVSEEETLSGSGQNTADYVLKTYAFIADSTTTILTLSDLSVATSGVDLLLDNVRVTAGAVRTLTVNSPVAGGVNVTVSPADLAAAGNGTTSFTRSYVGGTTVNLTAQAVAGGGNFLKWQKDGSDFAVTAATSVMLDQDATMTAIYSGNAAPVAADDSHSVDEDAQLVVTAPGILTNDTDPEGGAITAVLETTTSHGSLTLAADGSFTYTPAADYYGSDSFVYHTNDGELNSAPATVTITVQPVNDAPLATAQSASLDEDVATAVVLAGTDVLDGDSLTFSVVDQPLHGALGGTPPNLTYTPELNYNGTDSFTFVANDGTVDSAPATVSLTIAPVADEPVATAQSVTLTAATAKEVTLAGTDPDGSALTFTVATNPTHGTLSGTAPNLIYTPTANFEGSDSFTFTVDDGTTTSPAATVSITVNSILVNGSFEDGDIGVGPSSATEIPGWSITGNSYEVVASSAGRPSSDGNTNGSKKLLVLNTLQRPASAVLSQTFATTPGQPYLLTFDVGTQAYNTSHQILKVSVTGGVPTPLDPPVIDIQGGANQGTKWQTPSPSRTYAFVASSASTTLTFTDQSPASTDIDLLLDNVKVTGQVTRVLTVASSPDPGVSVTASPVDIAGNGDGVTGFTRTYLDGAAVTLTAPASIAATNFQKWQKNGVDLTTNTSTTVTMDAAHTLTAIYIPNAPPVALADSYSTNEDVQLVVSSAGVLANDSDPELGPMTAVLDVAPEHGALVLNTDGSFTYTPAANYQGADSFTYHASDGVVSSEIVAVSLTVNAVNDAPLAAVDSYTVDEDGVLTVAAPVGVLANDSDIETDALTAVLNEGPSHGSLTLQPDGGFVYTPAVNYNGPDSFTYHANDGAADSTVVTVSIEVNPINDVPVASADAINLNEDVATSITLVGNDVDGDGLTFTVDTPPAHGSLSGTGANRIYTPDSNYHGSDSFTFMVNDGTVDSSLATVTITVESVNDAPAAVTDSYTTDEDTPLVIAASGVLGNDSDVESDLLTAVIDVAPDHGSVVLGSGGGFTYTPAANYHGPDSFTYHANDGTTDSAIVTVSLTVNPINDMPVAAAQTVNLDEDVATGITLTASDADGDSLDYVVTVNPLHGTLSGTAPDLTYTPAANYHGPDTFSFKVDDGTAESAEAVVTIAVAPVNDAPAAIAQSATVDEDSSVAITLAGTDVEGSSLSYAVVDAPAHGTFNLVGAVLTYTPAADYNGPDSFTFKVNDGAADSTPATVSITVSPVADGGFVPPTIEFFTGSPDGIAPEGDYLLYIYQLSDQINDDESITVSVEWSTNLSAWTEAEGTAGVVSTSAPSGDPGISLIKTYIPRSLESNGRLFARLKIAAP